MSSFISLDDKHEKKSKLRINNQKEPFYEENNENNSGSNNDEHQSEHKRS
jgi:hypothetical protein